MMCVGSVAVIWLVDYWVLYGQPWLMPTHPQRPTHKITALPYQRSSSCCTAKYQDDHFRLTTDQKKSFFQKSTFCGCTDFLLYEIFLWLSMGFYPFLHTLLGIRCADGRAQKYLLFVCFVVKQADLFERLGWSRVTCPMLQENTTWAAWIVKDWICKYWTGSTH